MMEPFEKTVQERSGARPSIRFCGHAALGKAVVILATVLAMALCCSCSSGSGGSTVSEPPKELYALHLDVDYESNLLLAVYDVEVLIDGQAIGEISQGNTLSDEAHIEAGTHTLRFQKKGNSSVSVEKSLKVEGESFYSCTLKAHMAEIELMDEQYESAEGHSKRVTSEAEAKAEQERIEQDAKAKADAIIDDLNACVGKNAVAAGKVAKRYDYEAHILDARGEDITQLVGQAEKGSKVRKSKVKSVKLDEFMGVKSAEFTLEYALPGEEWLASAALSEAIERLKGDGIPYRIADDNTGLDMTSEYEAGDYDAANAVVVGTDWASGHTSVDLRVLSTDQIKAEKKRESMRDSLDEKLDSVEAWQAVQRYGKDVVGSKFKVHYILGRLAEEPWDEDTWFLKAECDVDGQSGYTVEAKVTGTSNNPVVIDFNVY